MKKINEIFYSVQGEGRFTGRPAIFIRLSGCNLKCPFCDTKHQEGKEMTDGEILEELAKYPSKFIVITGGEPGLQLDCDFIDMLHRFGFYVAVETNGTRPLPKNVDWVTLSPKFEFTKGAELNIDKCDELKVVYDGNNNDMARYDNIHAFYNYLQPMADCEQLNDEATQKAIAFCLKNPEWNLSLQTQKILKVK